MIRIAVVEDDEDYIAVIKKYIVRYMKEKGDTISVDVFQDGNHIETCVLLQRRTM